MNDELQKQLAELLKALLAAAQGASAWAGEQIPPLVQEKIWFGRAWSSFLALVCLVGSCYWLDKARIFYAEAHASKCDPRGVRYDIWFERPGGLAFIFATAIGLMGALAAVINTHEALLAWVAPRLYIVEWLLSLTRP